MTRRSRLQAVFITVLAVGLATGIAVAYRTRRSPVGFPLSQAGPTDPYRGRWVDERSKSSVTFLTGGRVQIRLFDLLNVSELSPDEIVDMPVNTGSVFGDNGPKYEMKNWKVNGKPATLTQGCGHYFVLERTELVKMVARFDETPKRRWWGTRFTDARYSIGDKGNARVYVVAAVDGEEMNLTIAAATLQQPGALKLARDGIGDTFFTLERVFRKAEASK